MTTSDLNDDIQLIDTLNNFDVGPHDSEDYTDRIGRMLHVPTMMQA